MEKDEKNEVINTNPKRKICLCCRTNTFLNKSGNRKYCNNCSSFIDIYLRQRMSCLQAYIYNTLKNIKYSQ